jgi:two-component system phosphate regulon response regulator PhoB
MNRPTVLIIAADQQLRVSLAEQLYGAQCAVETAANGQHGTELIDRVWPDIVLVEHRLPDADTLDVCRRIRQRCPTERWPLFILLPRLQRMAGNPVSQPAGEILDPELDRLALAMRSLVDRVNNTDGEAVERITCHGLTIDRQRHRAVLEGRDLNLTLTEFRIIWTLASRPGIVVSRRQLMDNCCSQQASIQERTIDAHVRAIRQKLGDQAALIETVRGVGYRLADREQIEA